MKRYILKAQEPPRTADESRRAAHELMRQLHPEVNWHLNCVHHRDQNPMNNSLDNLEIIDRSEHITLHRAQDTEAELLRHLRASFDERGRILDKLLVARMVDLASVAMLIDRSSNSDALSELKEVILDAVEVIKGLRRKMEAYHENPKT